MERKDLPSSTSPKTTEAETLAKIQAEIEEAMSAGYFKLADSESLIAKGASLEMIKNKLAMMTLDNGLTPLQLAANFGYVEMARAILSETGEDKINDIAKGSLIVAINKSKERTIEQDSTLKAKYLEIASLLLQHKADPNIPSKTGIFALQAAAEGKSLELVRKLLEHKADSGQMFQVIQEEPVPEIKEKEKKGSKEKPFGFFTSEAINTLKKGFASITGPKMRSATFLDILVENKQTPELVNMFIEMLKTPTKSFSVENIIWKSLQTCSENSRKEFIKEVLRRFDAADTKEQIGKILLALDKQHNSLLQELIILTNNEISSESGKRKVGLYEVAKGSDDAVSQALLIKFTIAEREALAAKILVSAKQYQTQIAVEEAKEKKAAKKEEEQKQKEMKVEFPLHAAIEQGVIEKVIQEAVKQAAADETLKGTIAKNKFVEEKIAEKIAELSGMKTKSPKASDGEERKTESKLDVARSDGHTLLSLAIARAIEKDITLEVAANRWKIVVALIDAGANPKKLDKIRDGDSNKNIFHFALEFCKDKEMLFAILLNKKFESTDKLQPGIADELISSTTRDRQNALSLAIAHHDMPVVGSIIKHYQKSAFATYILDDSTTLHNLLRSLKDEKKVQEERINILNFLLSQRFNPNKGFDDLFTQPKPLHFAAECLSPLPLQTLLDFRFQELLTKEEIQKDAKATTLQLNAVTLPDEKTALHFAGAAGRLTNAALLIARGANPFLWTNKNATFLDLYMLSEAKEKESVKVLPHDVLFGYPNYSKEKTTKPKKLEKSLVQLSLLFYAKQEPQVQAKCMPTLAELASINPLKFFAQYQNLDKQLSEQIKNKSLGKENKEALIIQRENLCNLMIKIKKSLPETHKFTGKLISRTRKIEDVMQERIKKLEQQRIKLG